MPDDPRRPFPNPIEVAEGVLMHVRTGQAKGGQRKEVVVASHLPPSLGPRVTLGSPNMFTRRHLSPPFFTFVAILGELPAEHAIEKTAETGKASIV